MYPQKVKFMIKEPKKEIISKEANLSVIATEYGNKVINVPWHNHHEIEIVYIKEGTGTVIVADLILTYKSGDLFFMGSNVPHSFKSEDTNQIHSVFQINPDVFENLRMFAEFSKIHSFLNNSLFGLLIENADSVYKNYLLPALKADVPEKPIALMRMLNSIETGTFKKICNIPYYSDSTNSRLEIIYNYIINNFSKNITLDDVAHTINLSKTAFCNYFKKKTNKTFSSFLNEIRINKACLLLKETDSSVAEICYNCGFNSLSYFNKVFHKQKGMSPLHYKKEVEK